MDRILRYAEVRRLTGLSGPTLWRLEQEREFPARRKLSNRSVGWMASEIEAWLETRPPANADGYARPRSRSAATINCAILGRRMKARPIPADFGISETDISEIRSQDLRAGRIKSALNLVGIMFVGSSFLWPRFVLSRHPELPAWAQVVGYFALVFSSIWAAAALITKIEQRLVLLHPKSGPVHRYQQAVTAFEDWWVRTKAEHWQRLSGRGFELELARLFNAIGWEAKTTRESGDRGIDIEAKIDGARVIVQCKAHSKPISPSVARELYGTLAASKAQSAILASVSGFGPGVHAFVAGKPIELIDLPWILEKQQGLDYERMPTAPGHAGMARWIRRVKPSTSRGYGRRRRSWRPPN